MTDNGSPSPVDGRPGTPERIGREIISTDAEVDLEEIMQRVREGVQRGGRVGTSSTSETHISPFEEGQAGVDLACLHTIYDIQDVGFASHRGILAPIVVTAKKIVRKLLAPILSRQVSYNSANTRVVTHIKDWLGALQRDHRALQRDHLVEMHGITRRMDHIEPWVRDEVSSSESRLRRALAAHTQESRDLAAHMQRFRDAHEVRSQDLLAAQAGLAQQMRDFCDAHDVRSQDVFAAQAGFARQLASQLQAVERLKQTSVADTERIRRLERMARRILHALEAGATLDTSGRAAPSADGAALSPRSGREPDFDYGGFEDRFRGTEVEIKERQRDYVPLFVGRKNVLDVGCGRGEFLDILRESEIDARGVDLDLDMVLLCKDKGLDVSMADAFAHLESLPDESLGGVFAAQVIEHLHPRRVIELVRLCHRKLEPGAALVLETPNPKCLMVFADSFYKDPSHVQPIHPDTMHFLLEATGFAEVELRFLGAVDPALRIPPLRAPGIDLEHFNQGIERLNSLLFGFQDYAVVGKKARASARHPDR
jgi:O-antigen chain-terminating methyltransferase